jgi:hypothetical protein
MTSIVMSNSEGAGLWQRSLATRHLLRNPGEAVRTAVDRHHAAIRRVIKQIAEGAAALVATMSMAIPDPVKPNAAEPRSQTAYAQRQARFEEAAQLKAARVLSSALPSWSVPNVRRSGVGFKLPAHRSGANRGGSAFSDSTLIVLTAAGTRDVATRLNSGGNPLRSALRTARDRAAMDRTTMHERAVGHQPTYDARRHSSAAVRSTDCTAPDDRRRHAAHD